MMPRTAAAGLLISACLWSPPVCFAQDDAIRAELDAYWAGVVRAVVQWDVDAQKAAYHPDAIAVYGEGDAYATRLMAQLFQEVVGTLNASPPVNPGLEFRFSSRVHDANTAHEIGMYHFRAEGREEFFGTVEVYLVKKDGRWLTLVEIRRGEGGRTRAEWDALATPGRGGGQ